ncbi:MAG: RdgB/HAM1 family non-canonical purine NTP pyrophosphatase [Christensenellaceae bacterium]|nr:RdgB/HAM1 family non-canonical purine NTP pyrophosphatase [Christensenellaceae bacterium]
MSRLIIATNNQGKVREIKAIFQGIYDEVLSLKDAGIKIDVEEDGSTFLENSTKKSVEVSRLVDCDCMADDSGICVDGLNGAPGIYSARYSAEGTDEANRFALIEAVRPLDKKDRSARFHCALTIANNGKVIFSCEETSDTGEILLEERGENGFGYDSLFYLESLGKTFAEIDPETKNSISHRARALESARKWLTENK